MMSRRNKYICYLVIVSALLNVCLAFTRSYVFAEIKPYNGAEIAIAFFLLYESLVIWITDSKKKTMTPRQSVNLFLGLKVGKMILSLLFVAIYAIAVKVELKRFVLVFVGFYLVYLLFDTIYLANGEKRKTLIINN
jgi:hypothetical protein